MTKCITSFINWLQLNNNVTEWQMDIRINVYWSADIEVTTLVLECFYCEGAAGSVDEHCEGGMDWDSRCV